MTGSAHNSSMTASCAVGWPVRHRAGLATLALFVLSACSPTFDWREFVPEGTDISVSFPCRPDRLARLVVVAGAQSNMQMLSCSAGDATFALAFVDIADPARVGAALTDLRSVAIANLQGVSPKTVPLQIKGMTPNQEAVRLTIAGKLPDGAAVRAHAAFFAHGLRVYQATVIGAQPPPQAADTFLGALKFAE